MNKLKFGIFFVFALAFYACDSGNGTSPSSGNGEDDAWAETKPQKSLFDSLSVNTIEELPPCNSALQNKGAAVGNLGFYFCLNGEWQSALENPNLNINCENGFLIANAGGTFIDETTSSSGISFYGESEFLFGATIKVTELDPTQFFRPGNKSFSSCLQTKEGSFQLTIPPEMSPYIEVAITGYLKNVVTGLVSKEMVTLKARGALNAGDTLNVNLLTHLEIPRVEQHLMASGGMGSIELSKKRAEPEIFNAFGIDTLQLLNNLPYGLDLENYTAGKMSIKGNSEYSGALLALYVMLLGGRSETEMVALTDRIAEDLKGDGIWNDQNQKVQIGDFLVALDSSGRFYEVRNAMGNFGMNPVPNFENHLKKFWPQAIGLSECNALNAGSITFVNNSMSVYFANDYNHTDHSKVRFICDTQNLNWRIAQMMEKDTAGFGVGAYDREIKEGAIEKDNFYIFDNGSWRLATPEEADGFTGLDKVYTELAADEKVVFIIRHAERTNETGEKGHLTDNGKKQAQNLGAKLVGEDFYFAYSGFTRTKETCENIAKGKGQSISNLDVLPFLNGEWYVKDEKKVDNYMDSDGGGWVVYSKYGFLGSYDDAFYELKTRSEELLQSAIALTNTHRVSILATHDFLVVPLLAYVTNGTANVRYYEKNRWVNYLSGVAIIVNAKGDVRYIPVKGLEQGTMQ